MTIIAPYIFLVLIFLWLLATLLLACSVALHYFINCFVLFLLHPFLLLFQHGSVGKYFVSPFFWHRKQLIRQCWCSCINSSNFFLQCIKNHLKIWIFSVQHKLLFSKYKMIVAMNSIKLEMLGLQNFIVIPNTRKIGKHIE